MSNTASWAGGGLWLSSSPAVLSDNTITSNDALYGGGLTLFHSSATVTGNAITANRAEGEGGGVGIVNCDPGLVSNVILGNSVDHQGGGLYLYNSDATFTNNVIADNTARTLGSGMYLQRSAPQFLHTTIARNGWSKPGADGVGLYVIGWPLDEGYDPSTVSMTNTIIVSHTVGLTLIEGNSASLHTTLWYGNSADWAGEGIVDSIVGVRGRPMFDTDGYHLTAWSDAIDRALDAGLTTDIDGDARPQNLRYDLGADEFVGTPGARRHTYLPFTMHN